ncbi:peroxidase-like [Acyrthosiphon pisum]|uniref:Peroxidase n=1 Tax=Acyrthosiphon pisum TaxID=7029 RepID=A0A8R2NKG2_ACYPI|nr:peroxidase-like [Acyrthosiphon pisum]|eukprot:XP_001951868.4 PREDICTED: peroxidase-like [Acyrthosiphon pisum]
MIRMNTSIIIVRLLICTVMFVPPCCRGFKDRRIPNVYEQGLVINSTNWYLQLDISDVNDEIQKAVERIENRYRSEDIILSNVSRLTIGSTVHGQLIDSMPSKDGHSESRNAEIILEVTRSLKNTYCLKHGLSDIQCAKDLTKVNLTGTKLSEMCMPEYYNNNSCIGYEYDYRSFDGSCNNLKRKYLGKANTPYKRLLFPAYRDGVYEMPNTYEEMLPNPRTVSTNFVKDENSSDSTKTMMMAYWAMFIGHDLSHTAVSTMGKEKRFVNCCDKDKSIQSSLNKNIRSCKPIFIPNEDRFFKTDQFDCMNYVRSRPAVRSDCTFGPMEQMNQATHYLDASMIYGTTEQHMLSLRQMGYGQVWVEGPNNYPVHNNITLENTDTNVCQNGSGTCYMFGDIRGNAFPQLSVLYNLWMKEHNRLAYELSREKPNWNDDQLFWEARKIVTACIQHITYNEWLPALLGVNYTKENGLGLGDRTTYDENADPTVSNSFATAILPFANSMITDLISFYMTDHRKLVFSTEPSEGRPYFRYKTLKGSYNRPLELDRLFRAILKGLTVQPTQKVDMLFTQTITNYLYSIDPNNSFGMDILSLNIQRSRDHGIPSYTQFRKYCGLKDIENMQDLSEIMVEGSADRLLKLYKTWNDIDLLVGALLEKHVDDAMVGPTMRCIIREQFVRTRIADRYFYDVPGVFSDYQLEDIQRVTLARIICNHQFPPNNGLTTLKVFLRPEIFNGSTLHRCHPILIPEINTWSWFDTFE